MRGHSRRQELALAAGILALVAAGGATFAFFYTPTITLRVENDTAQQVTLTGCASDPATLDPGQSVAIDPNASDPKAACVVYRAETREVLGCLYIPTTRYRNDVTVRLSLYIRGVAVSVC